ncbi:MAG: hypothetical protein IBX39_00835 [Candidatus Methanoperedenaceae archaeon]|nr:hypothetical protein [Candidatus Methanoperedenaceae archaeon]
MEPDIENKEYAISVLNARNEVIDVMVSKCSHCNEIVPRVGICGDCNTAYVHKQTLENPDTGFIHFIYECGGCPPDKRKAQKTIKVNEGNGRTESTDQIVNSFL